MGLYQWVAAPNRGYGAVFAGGEPLQGLWGYIGRGRPLTGATGLYRQVVAPNWGYRAVLADCGL